MQLRIDVRIDATGGDPGAFGTLQVSESLDLGTLTFLEMTSVIGRFHELGVAIREARERSALAGTGRPSPA